MVWGFLLLLLLLLSVLKPSFDTQLQTGWFMNPHERSLNAVGFFVFVVAVLVLDFSLLLFLTQV